MVLDLPYESRRLPNVWGEGGIFAFSGLHGETSALSGFAASAESDFGVWTIDTPQRRTFSLRFPQLPVLQTLTHDTFVARLGQDDCVVTFLAWHTVIGQLPEAVTVHLESNFAIPGKSLGCQISRDSTGKDVLALAVKDGRFALAYGHSLEEARKRALGAAGTDPLPVATERLDWFTKAVGVIDAKADRLLRKCLSVIAAHTLSAEGAFAQTWTAAHRLALRQLRVQDSVALSLGLNLLDPDKAWESLVSIFTHQEAEGFLPQLQGPGGERNLLSAAPLLSWAAWENHRAKADAERLRWILPRLELYLAWIIDHRDYNSNRLLEWTVDASGLGSPESGMDNSPRFDSGAPADAVDASTFAASDMFHLVKLHAAAGDIARAEEWQTHALELSGAINLQLWNERFGFYLDRDFEGTFIQTVTAAGFLPLMLPSVTPPRVARLLKRLEDPAQFAADYAVPAVSLTAPQFSDDAWRGCTFVTLNYLLIRGLRQHGRKAAAEKLAKRTIELVSQHFERAGVIFEFYDPKGQLLPEKLGRAGAPLPKPDYRKKLDNLRDHGPTAALVAHLILDYFPKYDPNFR